jgi:AcrR family transcriptional regulator
MARRYRLKARAQRQDDNRRRIVEAAYHLHMTVGPAHTTTSAIARLAGVERPTVQRHFPDLATLFMACSLHGMQLNPPPDPEDWERIADPRERLRAALGQQYPYYRVHRTLFRDIDQFFETPGLDALRAALGEQRQRQRDVLAQNWLVPMNREAVIAAAIGHALDFWTWKSLTENQGLGDDDAATLMAQMVQGVADDQEFRTI